MPKDKDSQEFARLQWQCRRGVLELDLLLEKVLHQHYEHLTPPEQQRLSELFSLPDEMLSEWLLMKHFPTEWADFLRKLEV